MSCGLFVRRTTRRPRGAAEGWHDTGDIVSVDAKGFVRILGGPGASPRSAARWSRWPRSTCLRPGYGRAPRCAVILPDARKGEQIVLVTDNAMADRAALLAHSQAKGYPELWVPKAILVTAAVPVMGNGKVDFVATQELARNMRPLFSSREPTGPCGGAPARLTLHRRPHDETGRRSRLKICGLRVCRFESGCGHQINGPVPHACCPHP